MVEFPVRVTPDDELIVDRYASTTDSVLLVLRMSEDREGKKMRPRPVVFDVAHVGGDRALEATVLLAPTGWIQSGYVRNNGAVKRGTFYVEVLMRAFGLPHTQLVFGQVYVGHNLALGVFEDPLASQGGKVDNEATTTLVNNTAVTRTITCPTNARWKLHGGRIFNADNVTRTITVTVDNGTAAQNLFSLGREAVAAAAELAYPCTVEDQDMMNIGEGATLDEADRIEIIFAAGGASAGGTARSSAVVEEWIEV